MLRQIVFDLEWNYGFSKNMVDYYGQPQNFFGELLQIGAVDPLSGEQFLCTLRLEQYPELHPRVRWLTGLKGDSQSTLSIKEGLEQFRDWCGEDCLLLSWSQNDGPVLKQNLLAQGLGEEWPLRFGDLQELYRLHYGSEKSEPPLEEALERLEISMDYAKHDALSDAQAAAAVWKQLGAERCQAAWDEVVGEMEQISADWENVLEKRWYLSRLSRDSQWLDPSLAQHYCPNCGALMEPQGRWLHGRDNQFRYALHHCNVCGEESLIYWLTRRCCGLFHHLCGVIRPDEAQYQQYQRSYARSQRRHAKAVAKAKAKAAAAAQEAENSLTEKECLQ